MRDDNMLNFLRLMGVVEFPALTVGAGMLLGLLAAFGIKFWFWRNVQPGVHVCFGLTVVGLIVGGFLGFCYHLLVENCYLGSW